MPALYRLREQDFGGGDAGYYGGGGGRPGGGGQRGGSGGGNKIQCLERKRLEQDRIDDGGRKQLGEDSGASSGALCGDERGGLYAVMAGEGPAGRSIGW